MNATTVILRDTPLDEGMFSLTRPARPATPAPHLSPPQDGPSPTRAPTGRPVSPIALRATVPVSGAGEPAPARGTIKDQAENAAHRANAAAPVVSTEARAQAEATAMTLAEELANDLAKPMARKIAQEMAQEIAKEMAREMAQEMAQKMAQALAPKMAKEMAEDMAKEMAVGMAEKMAKDLAQEASQRHRLQRQEELAGQRQRLDRLLQELPAERQRCLEDAEDDMLALVFETICRVLGEQVATPEGLRALLQTSLQAWHGRSPLSLHLHPDDLSWLQDDPACRDMLHARGFSTERASLRWVADPQVTLGGCLLRGAEGALDARLDVQLQALKQSLLQTRHANARRAPGALPPSQTDAPIVVGPP